MTKGTRNLVFVLQTQFVDDPLLKDIDKTTPSQESSLQVTCE